MSVALRDPAAPRPTDAGVHAGAPLAPLVERTLPELLFGAAARFGALPALGGVAGGASLTFAELEARVAHAAAALASLGVGEGDRVAILAENRPEWLVLDHAIASLGAVSVPVYPALPAGQVTEILADAEPRVVVASTAAQAAKVPADPSDPRVLVLDADAPGRETLDALLATVPPPAGATLAAWRTRACAVRPEALATLIYTSGTTGTPKGVMLSHGNLAAMVAATRQHGALVVQPGDVALSILPLAHVFERAASHYFLAHGVGIVIGESMQTVARDLASVRPHHVVAVPRLFEKVHGAVTGAPGVKGRIARWAARTAVAWTEVVTRGGRPGPALRARHALADRLVYAVLRARVGGRLRTFISGGAPLDARVGALFTAAGLAIHEGYGLTETSPVISANRPGAVRLGSAGRPFPGVEVRLGAEREIQVRGPGVTAGYWRRPEATAEAFTADGWFRTGDIGTFEGETLFVVDRLKDLIVTAGGKNVAPQPLEQRIVASPLVAQAVLLGDRRPYLVLLVVPEPEAVGSVDAATLAARLAAEVVARLDGAARVERPKRLAVVRDAFSVENGLLTPTLKVRRRAVERAHAPLLEALYASRAGADLPWPDGG